MKSFKFPRVQKQIQDIDYWSKLSVDEKRWMLRFLAEYYAGSFSTEPIHAPENRKDCYNNSNAQRRDLFNNFNRVDVSPETLENQVYDNDPLAVYEDDKLWLEYFESLLKNSGLKK